MKKFVVPMLVGVLLLVCTFSLRSCYRAVLQLKQEKEANEQLRKNLKPSPLTPVKTITAKNGAVHQVFEPAIVDTKSNVLTSGFLPKQLADSLKKIIQAKDKEIYSITAAKLSVEAKLQAVLKTDSNNRKFAYAKDSVFNLSYFPDSNIFHVAATVKFTQVDYTKKKLFGSKIYKTELFPNDKRITISEVYRITKPLEEKKKRPFLPTFLTVGVLATTYLLIK